jgi:signal transduction histidine kinase/HAMP domain-containing protein
MWIVPSVVPRTPAPRRAVSDMSKTFVPRVRIANRLGTKILAVMGGVLIVSSLVSLGLLMPVYLREMLAERQLVSSKLGAMLQITLENAMLKRDIDGLREIVERLGTRDDVKAVMIVSPAGEVRFSSLPERLGHRYDGLSALCADCGLRGDREEAGTAFVREADVGEVLRSVNVVANREACVGCHGPIATNPVNGLLVVDYNAADLKRRAVWTTALLATIGFAIVLGALAATWLALRRLVFAPVRRITDASGTLAAGDFSARAAVVAAGHGTDEMTELGRQFDAMAARLEDMVITMQERDRFLQALIDAVPDGIRVIDRNYTVMAANKAFCDQVRLDPRDVVGQPCYVSSHGRSEPCVPTLVLCPLVALEQDAGPIKCLHTHLVRPTGHGAAVEVTAARLDHDRGDGGVGRIVESVRDLTRQVEVSQEQRLSEIGLLANGVAHEIHNPLSSIRLGLRAIDRRLDVDGLDADVRRYLTMIDGEIDRCLDITQRLMWLSQPPGTHGELVDLGRVVHDVVALLGYEAQLRELDLETEVNASARIIAESREIGMVLLNLIQNAFHACRPGGSITVSATLNGPDEVQIVVADTGVGIDPEDRDKIFYPFWSRRADGSTGSGLGLSICKSVVGKWHGRIDVDSSPGHGTRFRLTFPSADKTAGIQLA